MLNKLQQLNPHLNLKLVNNDCFKSYGKIIEGDVSELIEYVSSYMQTPKSGNIYIPSDETVEKSEVIQRIKGCVYGGLEIQAGTVCGYNTELNGIEYHQGSETIIAITDFILSVGHCYDMKNSTYDLSLCESFYVPAGSIVDCFSTTLHYTPLQANSGVFKTICILLKGTGNVLQEGRIGILKKQNKWFIAHPDNHEKVKSGDYPGCTGKMIKVNF